MNSVDSVRKSVSGVSKQALQFVRIAFGLRSENAPRLSAQHARVLSQRAKLVISAVVLLTTALYLLVREISTSIDKLLAGREPLPDLREFVHGYGLLTTGAYCIAGAGFLVALYAYSLRRRFQLGAIFLVLPLVVVLIGVAFQPLALQYYKARIGRAYAKGVTLFRVSKFDECSAYFSSFYDIAERTYVGDNVLGRLAGCAYHLGRYEDCVRLCADLLNRYPDTDIRSSIQLTLRWAMQRIGASEEPGKCQAIYEDHELHRFGLSPFFFCLDALQLERPSRLAHFGTMKPPRATLAHSLLDDYADDALAPKAAYLAGARGPLEKTLGRSPESRLYFIVRGDDALMLQRWDDALGSYSSYLSSEPRGDYRSKAQQRLVRAVLGRNAELDAAFADAVRYLGENFDHDPACRDLLVGRLLYEADSPRMEQVYRESAPLLSLEMRAHMAAGMAERFDLEGEVDRAATYRSESRRLVDAAREVKPVDEPWGLALPTVDAGLVDFCNERLAPAGGAEGLWDVVPYGAESDHEDAEVLDRVAPVSYRLAWLHAIDARYQDEIVGVRPPGARSFTERLCDRLERELATLAAQQGDPIKAIPMLADLRPRAGDRSQLRIVWPVNAVIERQVQELEAKDWSAAGPDACLQAVDSLIAIRWRIGEPKRLERVAHRALESCASAVRASARFADAKAAATRARNVAFKLGRSRAQVAVADAALMQCAESDVPIGDYVSTTRPLWGYCSKEALADAQRVVYVRATRARCALTLDFVDAAFETFSKLENPACVDQFALDLGSLGFPDVSHDVARIVCEGVAERLARSQLRTYGVRVLVPPMFERMAELAADTESSSARTTLRELAVLALKSPKTLDVAADLFGRYVAAFPDDPFVENCRSWRAWLWCLEAYHHRATRDLYVRCLRRAEGEYAVLIDEALQPLIVLRARRALHVVRRKIAEVASGEQSPLAYARPAELRGFEHDHACLWEAELRDAVDLAKLAREPERTVALEASAKRAAATADDARAIGASPLRLALHMGRVALEALIARVATGAATR